MKIYTRTGDKGTTGLLYGGRVAKDSAVIEANGAVDEAQAALGLVRAEVEPGSELDGLLVGLERDLYVLMAEVATAPSNRHKLSPGTSLVTASMVAALEGLIDDIAGRFPPIDDFVIPGHDRVSAGLDLARTIVRRAERNAIGALLIDPAGGPTAPASSARWGPCPTAAVPPAGADDADAGGSLVVQYLNRLSDLLWAMARWQEQGDSLLSRKAGPQA